MNNGCTAGSDSPAASIAPCAVLDRSKARGIAEVNPAAIADFMLKARKSRLFINSSK
jgi:hypothetical protein